MKYIIEEGFDDKFVAELQKRGLEYEINDGKEFAKIGGENVIIRGKVRHSACYPGDFYDHYCYNFKNFAIYFGDDLLNNDYFLIPLGDLTRRRNSIHDMCGDFFIRPANGDKMFDGQIIYINKDIPIQIQANIESHNRNNDLIVIAKRKTIIDEYRLVIYKNKCIAGSMYKSYGSFATADVDIFSHSITRFGEKMASKFSLRDDIYIMDVCRYNDKEKNKYGVIELNCFGWSDLYDSNRSSIIDVLESMEET